MRHPVSDGGFTLMELMIAIGIIALLGGLLFPAVRAARRGSDVRVAKATVERLKLACEAYSSDFGDFPPTSLEALGVRTNGRNEGAKSVLRCLTTSLEHGPYFSADEKDLSNLSCDALKRGDPCASVLGAKTLFEIVDPWGNPYFYFHNRDYEGGRQLERYVLGDGRIVQARPLRSEKTGEFPAATSFMIWSAGPNGINENGQGDDVCSWK